MSTLEEKTEGRHFSHVARAIILVLGSNVIAVWGSVLSWLSKFPSRNSLPTSVPFEFREFIVALVVMLVAASIFGKILPTRSNWWMIVGFAIG